MDTSDRGCFCPAAIDALRDRAESAEARVAVVEAERGATAITTARLDALRGLGRLNTKQVQALSSMG